MHAHRCSGVLLLVLCGLLLAVVLVLPTSSARAGGVGGSGILPPRSHPYGQTYGAWSAAWVQYLISIPRSGPHPALDPTGAACRLHQTGPVFFLTGSPHMITRDHCTVPAGKALLVPLAVELDMHVPGDGLQTPQLLWHDLQSTAHFRITALHASVDGVPVGYLNPATTPYRACAGPAARCSAPPFQITVPADNIYGLAAGAYRPAVVDGVILVLAPLMPGPHTLTFSGMFSLRGRDGVEHLYGGAVSPTISTLTSARPRRL